MENGAIDETAPRDMLSRGDGEGCRAFARHPFTVKMVFRAAGLKYENGKGGRWTE